MQFLTQSTSQNEAADAVSLLEILFYVNILDAKRQKYQIAKISGFKTLPTFFLSKYKICIKILNFLSFHYVTSYVISVVT